MSTSLPGMALPGALLAACLPAIKVSPARSRVLGYSCLVALTGFAAVIPGANSFPGLGALVPVVATAGIIVAASNRAHPGDPDELHDAALGQSVIQLYLWHWPLLIVYSLFHHNEPVGFLPGLGIILLAGARLCHP